MAVALERGATIAVDELDASLHPILLASLVESFQNPDSNPKTRSCSLPRTTRSCSMRVA